jgi:hypothetical protein
MALAGSVIGRRPRLASAGLRAGVEERGVTATVAK